MRIPKFLNIRKDSNSDDVFVFDLPIFSFIGMSLGFLVTGVIYAIVWGLIDAEEGSICSFAAIMGGLSSIAISILVTGLAVLYWWVVPRRHAMLYPSLFWFGPLLSVLSFASGVLVSAELVINVTNFLK